MERLATSGDLPSDVMVDILTRLHGKSLMQFKYVCKGWRALIESRSFIEQHFLKQTALNLKGKNSGYLVVQNNNSFDDFSVFYAETHSVVEIISPPPSLYDGSYLIEVLGPCNGILCLYSTENNIALWNPTTQELKHLSKCPRRLSYEIYCRVYERFGFGFDPKTNDYKVVKFAEHYYPEDRHISSVVDMYSSKTDSWKRLDSSVVPENCLIRGSNAYVKGAHHWLAYKWDYSAVMSVDMAVMSVDMADEVIRALPFPDLAISIFDYNVDIASFNESLAFFLYPDKRGEKCLDLWVMNEYGVKESWTRQLTIGPLEWVERPLGFSKNGGLFLEDYHRQPVLYDPSTQEIKNLQVKGLLRPFQVLNYVQSLFPINGIREHEDEPYVHSQSQTSENQGHEDGASFDSWRTNEIRRLLVDQWGSGE